MSKLILVDHNMLGQGKGHVLMTSDHKIVHLPQISHGMSNEKRNQIPKSESVMASVTVTFLRLIDRHPSLVDGLGMPPTDLHIQCVIQVALCSR